MKPKPKKRRKVRAVIGRPRRPAAWENSPAHFIPFDTPDRPAWLVRIQISGTLPGLKPNPPQ